MDFFWKIFWRCFAVALCLLFVGGCVLSVIRQSGALFYKTIQLCFTVGLGIAGFIAMIIVPLELYLEDRKKTRGAS